jgi:tetrapyrrole methylase family protein/MazG family protein
MNFEVKESYDINDLLLIVARLRAKDGCPWDREQDHHSIRQDLIEEAYEAAEAIDEENPAHLREELGDLLLQIVFHASLEEEAGSFTFSDVCDGICKKLVYRHPHVFGDVRVAGTSDVLRNWDMLKSRSKGEQTLTDRLTSVPKSLPALMRGEKVGKRAGNIGFDYQHLSETFAAVREELTELEEAANSGDSAHIEEELGDLLLACCNLSRFLKKDSEKALTIAINKFIMRFRAIETLISSPGADLFPADGCGVESADGRGVESADGRGVESVDGRGVVSKSDGGVESKGEADKADEVNAADGTVNQPNNPADTRRHNIADYTPEEQLILWKRAKKLLSDEST